MYFVRESHVEKKNRKRVPQYSGMRLLRTRTNAHAHTARSTNR